MTVYCVLSLPKIPYMHLIGIWFWLTLVMSRNKPVVASGATRVTELASPAQTQYTRATTTQEQRNAQMLNKSNDSQTLYQSNSYTERLYKNNGLTRAATPKRCTSATTPKCYTRATTPKRYTRTTATQEQRLELASPAIQSKRKTRATAVLLAHGQGKRATGARAWTFQS